MNDNIIVAGDVNAMYRGTIPSKDETIKDDFDIVAIAKVTKRISVYVRNKEDCPLNRGCWVIDFFHDSECLLPIFCLKFPLEMKKEDVERWLKPLTDIIPNKYQ